VTALLGIDIGTSASKGCLVAEDGTMIAQCERPHQTSTPKPGWFEHDSERIWRADVLALCRELLASGPTPSAICVSGIGPCLLPATHQGVPLRPAMLYGIDTRATTEIDALNSRFGEEVILTRCGSPLTTQAVGPKLLWMRNHEPELWGQCRRFFMAGSYIVHLLTGEYVLDHHSASQCDPLYDLNSQNWAADWVAEVAPSVELPRLLWAGETAGTVTAQAAALTGLPEGLPVMAGTIDAWAEACSVGVAEPGQLMLMYGTTMFLVQVVAQARPDRRLWTTTGVVPGTLTLAAGMATSGALTSWFKDLSGASYDELLQEAGVIEPSSGLVVLPYFAGERTPLFDPQARGVIAGLTLQHGRGHLYRALLEATAYGVRHNLDVMAETAGPPTIVSAVGGGTRGKLWLQIVSDVCGVSQRVHQHSFGAAYGDARLAADGLGIATGDWNPSITVVEPDREAQAHYEPLYELYRGLYPATSGVVHRLSSIT